MPPIPALPARFADNPVLSTVLPVIEASSHVRTDPDRIVEVAGWMAYEALPMPQYLSGFPLDGGPDDIIDFTLVATCIDFAFTDFDSGARFEVDFAGAIWSDSDALFACLRRGLDDGLPLLDGSYLAEMTTQHLRHILRGSIEIPMLEERAEILRSVGRVLTERFDGRFRHLVAGAAPRLYNDGERDGERDGIVDRLTANFPRFDDVSRYGDATVRFNKLAQLGVWVAYTSVGGAMRLDDLDQMTAFADYIVPLGLELLGILHYSDELAATIASHTMLPRDSPQEVEIRAHTVYAVALLTEAINAIRPAASAIVMGQVDARIWTHFHTTFRPHHLTRTIMY